MISFNINLVGTVLSVMHGCMRIYEKYLLCVIHSIDATDEWRKTLSLTYM